MTTPTILALDLSLTSTGWARGSWLAGQPITLSGVIAPITSSLKGVMRLRWIRAQVMAAVREPRADLVVLEGYAFAAHASHAHELGELGGVIRVALLDAGIRFVDVNPSSLKLFATGKGNAKKNQVLADAVRKLAYAGHSTDEADALWLLEMARTHYAGTASNDAQRRGLAKVAWPALDVPTITQHSHSA